MPKALKKPNRGVKPTSPSLAKGGHDWQVQTAKAQFSEVFRRARTEGPQHITRQGKEGVVMISDEEYKRLVVRLRQPKNIVQFFRESPLVGVELNLERDKDTGRDIEL
jgi:prevent-host-death family protein